MAKLTKFRIKKSTKWSNINLTVIEDPTLSPKAKYIHTYLMTRPPGWEIRTKDIIKKSTAGRDAVYSGLKELVDKRYIHRERVYENGRIAYWNYDVHEEPLPEKLDPAKPEQENLVTANQDQENPDNYYSNTVNSKHKKSVSKETPRPSKLGRTKDSIPLRIKKRKKKKTNSKGLLYNSLAKPTSRADLSKWFNNHNINKYDDREKAIHEFQTELFAKKISPASHEIKEVLDYWNKSATEMRNNGHKLPVHQIKDTKNIYMCQLIITGILHTSGLEVEDIKKAIDNYSWILENSPWYNKIYPFPKFFSNKKLFDDCVTGYVKDNSRYVNSKKKPSKGGLLEGVKRLHKKTHGWEPSEDDIKMYKYWIREGNIKTEADFAGYVS